MLNQEFQAVVLAAGRGSRIPEITAGKPKCLLPVGNKPLVWYPLFKLQQLGVPEAILIILENQKSEVQTALDKTDLEIKIDYFLIPGNEDLGTADALRLVQEKIKSDLIVLSCDVITDVNLRGLLELFRKHRATVCCLLFHPQPSEYSTLPGPKTKHKPERDLIGIDAQTSRLVFLASASDFESNLTLPKSLVKKHANIVVHSNLIDSHIYVLKHCILEYLQHETNISTIKGELLPHIIKKQLSKPSGSVETNASVINAHDRNDVFHFAKESDLDVLIRETSSFNDHLGDMKSCYHGDGIRCYAYIADRSCFGVRVNTLPAYWSINGKITEKWDKITDGKELVLIDPHADIKSNQVDSKCIVWDSAKLQEKTSFKNSTIGANSEVNCFSRVFDSVIMNNVVIKERVALENCIVCDGAIIESGSRIKYCMIGSQHTVPEKSEHSNEVLTDSDRLMEF